MAKTSFVFSRFSNVNVQFMLLFKALDELKGIEPEDAAFRGHLYSLAGLLRYQFSFEEDLMCSSKYPRMQEHIQAHNRLRRFLAGILDVQGAPADQMVESHRKFRDDLRAHCRDDDNRLIQHIDGMHRSTTVMLQAKSEAILRE